MGREAGRRDEGQPRGRRTDRRVRRDAVVAHSLFWLREELPFLLCVTISIYLPLRCVYMNAFPIFTFLINFDSEMT